MYCITLYSQLQTLSIDTFNDNIHKNENRKILIFHIYFFEQGYLT